MVLIEIDQVQGKEQSQGMDSSGGDNPDAFVGPEPQPSDESFETREDCVSRSDVQAEKALPGLVVNAIGPSFHFSPFPAPITV
jgi:hypothetical protein